MDSLAPLIAIAASWVAPGAPEPEDPAGLDAIREFLAGACDLARCFDGHGSRLPGYYEATHPLNVAKLTLTLCRALGAGAAESEAGVRAALIHDLGMRLVPAPIRYKIGALTSEEIALLRRHPEHSARLADVLCGPDIAGLVLLHHERWDGTGYPRSLAGAQIPLLARILAVADSFDAMSSDRIYARRYSPALAHQAIRASAGRAFDPAVVTAFLAAVPPFPPGTPVRLANGESGTVVELVPDRPFRPIVRLEDGTEVGGRDVAALQIVRSAPRFTAGVPVRLRWAGEVLEGRTFNVSAQGAAVIEYEGRIRQGGDLAVEFRPRDGPGLEVLARIVWSRPSGGRGRLLGLWFGPVPAPTRAYLLGLGGDAIAPESGHAAVEVAASPSPGTTSTA